MSLNFKLRSDGDAARSRRPSSARRWLVRGLGRGAYGVPAMKERNALATMALALALALCSCTNTPVATEQTSNTNMTADKLFTINGCTVYRFTDNGSYHYFTDCRGSTSSRIFCGKGCYRPDEIQTITDDK